MNLLGLISQCSDHLECSGIGDFLLRVLSLEILHHASKFAPIVVPSVSRNLRRVGAFKPLQCSSDRADDYNFIDPLR